MMEKNPYPGRFVVVEGLDGSGQTTQAALLKNFFEGKKKRVILTKEPTKDSLAGKRIRKVLNRKLEIRPEMLQQLFAKDRAEHLANVIVPALREGNIVISDRYCFSSFAFGTSAGIDLELLIHINSAFLLPDLTVILQVRPEMCIERIKKRGDPNTLFEEEKKLRRVWQTYQILPDRFPNVYIIDGEKSIEEVFSRVKALLQQKLDL